MKIRAVFLSFLIVASLDSLAETTTPLTPLIISQQIKEQGLDAVFESIFFDQVAANTLLLSIDSGEKPWLDLAIQFMAVGHQRTESMLIMSVGEALQWSPDTVLTHQALLALMPIEKICSLDGLYEWRRFSPFLIQTAINRRLAAIESLSTVESKRCSATLLKAFNQITH